MGVKAPKNTAKCHLMMLVRLALSADDSIIMELSYARQGNGYLVHPVTSMESPTTESNCLQAHPVYLA